VFGIVLIFVNIPGGDLAYSVLGLVIFAFRPGREWRHDGLSPSCVDVASCMLKSSKLAVSGVTQSWQDIAHVVEAFVQRGNVTILC